MADNVYSTSQIPTSQMGETVYQMTSMVKGKRLNFERRWYDNNFFDDGYHYRFYSRAANKIVDVSDRATVYSPMRAIPKASRQIRGISNLLVAPDFTPVIYPEKVDSAKIPPQIQAPDPQTGQMTQVPNPMYQQEMQKSTENAHKVSRWVLKEWETQDMIEKIAFMTILAAKHGVSWMQIWPDAVGETIKTQVYDAFDIYINGELTDPSEAPFIIKATPRLISQIKADENFDEEQLAKISPDNRFASSDIKEAYMSTRYNKMGMTDSATTLIQKEALIKEYLNPENMAMIRKQDDGDQILKDKKEGDQVIRQVFVAGNVWLRDRYVNLPDYNFVDFRFEPGPIYQVPLIERFIPINKSLDALVSRAERYTHTMVAGIWLKKTGEQFKITNEAGGQIIEYNGTPPEQGQIAPIPSFFFELMGLLGSLIEEQGTSTSTLGKLPTGVKGNAAIESLKESEYANLVIASRRLKGTVKRITERMLDIADSHYITPKTVYDMENGKPNYFDVIGGSAMEGRKKLKIDNPTGVVPLRRDYKVDIDIQNGLAFTHEGKKAAAKELGDFLIQMAQMQLLSPEVVKVFVQKLLEIYNFGATEDIMEALNNPDTTAQLSEQQLTQMKMAVLQALKDAGEIGQEAQQNRLMENKVGVLEALKESGLLQNMQAPPQPVKESVSINYKDAPEDIKRQMEQEAGFQPSSSISPAGVESATKLHGATVAQQQADTQTHTALNPVQQGGSNGSSK